MRFSGSPFQPAAGLLFGLCFLGLLVARAAGDDPTPLGVWGDPGRVVVQGATAFGNEAVKSALFRDLDLPGATGCLPASVVPGQNADMLALAGKQPVAPNSNA